ncbi:MAG TPA: glucose-6-phosphate dehydrogenase [Actinomycetota bacterium]|nr:glucose-6-phosphate dehydrogenase [Actinomycetota bacterium]
MRPPDHVIVVFGANGDLSRRKLLPALFHLHLEGLMPEQYRVVGNARSALSDDQFRELTYDAVKEFGRCNVTDEEWAEFSSRLSFISHEFTPHDPEPVKQAVERAETDIGGEPARLFYLAVPPTVFEPIILGLGKAHLQERARVVCEKPFGTDLDDFTRLSAIVESVFHEEQIFRIDHFLGKETVQNILAFRFANGMFEPSWNRHHIDHVQIEVLEDLGIENRSEFYDNTGALRDMLVTHIFQLLGFMAMEPPPYLDSDPLAEEVVKLFRSMKPLRPTDVVRGQYEGYRDEPGIAPDSQTETFVAARAFIDNWRWAGVPFFLKTGKALERKRSSITLAFHKPPRQMFPEAKKEWFERDHLTLELGPDEGITMTFLAKVPGPRIELGPARMVFKYEGSFGSEMIEDYERLIHDALIGDRTLFTRGDGLELAWKLVDDVLQNPPPVYPYPKGSWGPKEADDLIAPRNWHSETRVPRWD